jgi:GTP diphosphokinase / guanosine-3',5'-bis(diphosphate) 3'-diphosphatase
MKYQNLLEAAIFAERKHRGQLRKDEAQTPYISHPLKVAALISAADEKCDPHVLMGAILHDTIEDTETTSDELRDLFGAKVTNFVLEVTDDKSLEKAVRKAKQLEKASSLSDGATLIKLGDKICNVSDVVCNPANGWADERRLAYVEWASSVVENCPDHNQQFPEARNALGNTFAFVATAAREIIQSNDSSNGKIISLNQQLRRYATA